MNQAEFRRFVEGKKISGVSFREKDCFGTPVLKTELSIESIFLEGGLEINFHASGQINVDEVWVSISDGG